MMGLATTSSTWRKRGRRFLRRNCDKSIDLKMGPDAYVARSDMTASRTALGTWYRAKAPFCKTLQRSTPGEGYPYIFNTIFIESACGCDAR